MKGIKGVKIFGNEVEFSWKARDFVSLSDLFDHPNKKRLILAFDEAQKLRIPHSNEIRDALAHASDYDDNLTFILTGSEVGLLYDLLAVDDPSSPLYGRHYHEIRVERFDKETSISFLKKASQSSQSNQMKERSKKSSTSSTESPDGWRSQPTSTPKPGTQKR